MAKNRRSLPFADRTSGEIDVEVADRIGLELPLRFLVAHHLGQSADAVSLEATMQGKSTQRRYRGLQA